MLKGNIELREINDKGRLVVNKYSCKLTNKPFHTGFDYKLALVGKHYFRNDNYVLVTKYALRNYDDICHMDDWYMIRDKTWRRLKSNDRKLKMKPHVLVNLLLHECNNLLVPLGLDALKDYELPKTVAKKLEQQQKDRDWETS